MLLLDRLLMLYWYVVLIRVVMSWINISPYSGFGRIIHALTEPVMGPLRRVVPPIGGLDLSPLVVFAAIWFLRSIL